MSFVLIRNRLLPKSVICRLFFGWLALGSIFVLLLVGSYFALGQINGLSSFLVLIVVSGLLLLIPRDNGVRPGNGNRLLTWSKIPLWTWLVLAADMILLLVFVLARTDQAIISPWNLLSSEVFILYAAATFFLYLTAKEAKPWLFLSLSVLHTFVTLSAAAIIYAVGFGFDPFIHRAAEQALLADGFIEPRQILYSGQYLLVTALHYLTSIPLKLIDVWLVPATASIVLPIASYIGLRHGWKVKEHLARIGSLGFLFLPMVLSYFTVPYTFTYTFFLALIFLLPLARRNNKIALILLLTSITMIFFHPLLAVPYTIWLLGYLFGQKKQRLFKVLTFLAISIAVPAMFVVHAGIGLQDIIIYNPLDRLDLFFNLFYNPFIDHFPYIPVFLDLLYEIRYYLPYCLLLIAGLGSLTLKKQKQDFGWYWTLVLGLIGAMFFSSTMFEIPGIIVHEQAEFALRLEQAMFTVVIPIVVLVLIKLYYQSKNLLRYALLILLAGIITINWYFTYPQFNLKYPFYSPSVSQTDLDTVQEIDLRASGQQYLVLSNQMTSAAALQEFGFANYYQLDGQDILWYAIPTGGPLYQEFIGMIEFGQIEQRMNSLQDKTKVDKIYLSLHSYWPWSEGLVSELAQTASDYFEQDNQIQVYIYNFNTN